VSDPTSSALSGNAPPHGGTPSPAPSGWGNAIGPIQRAFTRFDDGELVRWVFRGMLIGTMFVLGMDLRDLYDRNATAAALAPSETSSPVLPPVFETDKPLPADPRRFVTGEMEALRAPMHFTLDAGGVLRAEGAINVGSAERLAAELDARGEYVRKVSLNSPGGVLDEAIAMAELLRQRKIDTEVGDGALCASSCPLIFAGGEKRLAGAQSAIGVHQFFGLKSIGDSLSIDPAKALSDAQITTARISRHLQAMGVDPAAWLHALDTPPQSLYYFSQKELKQYRLATAAAPPRPQSAENPAAAAPRG